MRYSFLVALTCILILSSHFFAGLLGLHLSLRYLIYGIITYGATRIILGFIKGKKYKYILLIPVLINLAISIHSTVLGGQIFLPLGIIGLVSWYFAIRDSKNKNLKNSIPFIVLLLLSTYVYANWLHGFSYTIEKDKFDSSIEVFNQKGELIKLDKPQNKVIVLDFWSTNCAVCFKKFPEFESEFLKYKKDSMVELYSFYLPLKYDDVNDKEKLVEHYKFPKLHTLDLDAWKKLNIVGVPVMFIIDKNGVIRHKGSFNTKKFMIYNNFNSIIEKLKNE